MVTAEGCRSYRSDQCGGAKLDEAIVNRYANRVTTGNPANLGVWGKIC
jgi:hypothetical protein